MNHRFSHNIRKQKRKTLQSCLPQHIKLFSQDFQQSPNLVRFSEAKSKDLYDVVTKPHSTATKSHKKTINSIINSTSKKSQRKQRKDFYSDMSYGIMSINKSPRVHKYSQSFNLFNSKGSSDRLFSKKYNNCDFSRIKSSKVKSNQIKNKQQQIQEYVLFSDEIIKGNLSTISFNKQKEIKDENVEQQQDQFFHINQFYNKKAIQIQRVWKGYTVRKNIKQTLVIKNIVIQNKISEQNQPRHWKLEILNEVSQLLVTSRKQQQQNQQQLQICSIKHKSFSQSSNSLNKSYKHEIQFHKEQSQNRQYMPDLNSVQIISNHESLLYQSTQSYASLLQKLFQKGKISQNIYSNKMQELQRWSYSQNSELNYLKKLWQRQIQKSQQLIKIKQSLSLTNKMLLFNMIKQQDTDNFLKHFNLEDEKYNFSFYLFPECDSQICQKQQKPRVIEQNNSNKVVYTKQFKDLLDTTPIQKFPVFFEENHHLKTLIGQRILGQLSIINSKRIPVDTSIHFVSTFLDILCQLVKKQYANQFVVNVNTIYGYYPDVRLKFFGQFDIEEQIQQPLDQVINYNVFDELISQYQSNYNNYFEIHCRAIFDAFNQNINILRPYYYSDGIPYPWCKDNTLTFYQIGQENIQQVIDKIKFRLIRLSSLLCGLLVSINDEDKSAETSITAIQQQMDKNDPLKKVRVQNIIKSEQFQISEDNFRWYLFDEDITSLGLQLSKFMFSKLMVQTVAEIYKIQHYSK